MESKVKGAQNQQAVRENEATMRAGAGQNERSAGLFFNAVETTRMPIIVTDPNLPDNPIIFANPAFLKMTGYDAEEIIGHNCRFLQGPETQRELVDEVRSAIEDRREIAVELLNYKKDGSTFWNALFISPVYQDGELVHFFASQLDVSRRHEAEVALRRAQRMEAVGQLTGGIAHDFNNLLQVVQGYQEVVLSALGGNPNPDWIRDKLLNAQNAVKRATSLTQQLLAFARQQKLEGRVVNLNTIIQGQQDMARQTLGDDVPIGMSLQPDLRNCRVDHAQFEAALLNVVINARDAMEGLEKRSLMICTRMRSIALGDLAGAPAGEYVEVSVTDTGSGMSPEVKARVLEPFFTTKEEGKGTGLGLSMVYGFVQQSSGALNIESKVGEGTTISLFLPVSDEQEGKDGNSTDRSKVRHGSEIILVVEDRTEVGDVSQLFLESFGYSVLRAANAQEALDVMRSHRVDVLFTDLVMPGGTNGSALARIAKKNHGGLKVLLTTGYAEASIGRFDADGGEFDLIQKPFSMEDLGRRMRMVIDGATGVT